MDSTEGAQSLKLSSRECFAHECSPCKNDGLAKEAKFFCSECTEYLCDACESSHRRFRGTRQHQVVSGDDIPLTPTTLGDVGKSVSESSILCACNIKEVTIFCKDHYNVICIDCKTLHHRTCDCIDIVEQSIGFKDSTSNITITKADELVKRIYELQNERKEILSTFLRKAQDCKKEIRSFREELCEQIYKMEKNSIEEVDRLEKAHETNIQQQIGTYETALSKIVSRKSTLLLSQDRSDDKLQFIWNLRLAQELDSVNPVINDVRKDAEEPDISFARNIGFSDIQRCQMLGEIKCITHSFAGRIISEKKVISTVKIDTEANIEEIPGSVFMPSGELVLCTYGAYNIRVLNMDFSKKEELKVESPPWDVAVFNKQTVLITMPYKKKIQYVQVLPRLQVDHATQLDKECWGIEVYKGDIYVSCGGGGNTGEIKVLDYKFLCKKKIGKTHGGFGQFSSPKYLAMSFKGEIIVSDESLNSITRMPNDGSSVTNTYTVSNPMGVFVDGGNNAFVCCRDSNSIQVVDDNGINIKTLTITSEPMRSRSISFRQADSTFVVTSDRNSSTYALKMG